MRRTRPTAGSTGRRTARVQGVVLEYRRVARLVARARAQRGFPPAELLPALHLVLARHGQGGVPGAREHRRALRSCSAQPELRNETAERRRAQELRASAPAARVHAVQCFSARPFLLPVLRLARGPDLRSRRAALEGRRDDVGQRGRGVLVVQFAKGRDVAARIRHVPASDAVPAFARRAAPERKTVSAELLARKLVRLSLLGYGAGAVIISVMPGLVPGIHAFLSRMQKRRGWPGQARP